MEQRQALVKKRRNMKNAQKTCWHVDSRGGTNEEGIIRRRRKEISEKVLYILCIFYFIYQLIHKNITEF